MRVSWHSYTRSGDHPRRGFTLIELLSVIGIIGVLIGVLIPSISMLREYARRTADLSNLRQLTLACSIYSTDYDGYLPAGRAAGAPGGADNYIWTNYANCWKPLIQRVPVLAHDTSCQSVLEGYSNADDFGLVQPSYGWPDDVMLGWIYWGGRDNLSVSGSLKYRSMHRFADRNTPGSPTLWTCLCWDSAGAPSTSVCPHVGSHFVEYPSGTPLKPPPSGLAVALADGSASFVPWDQLITIPQANGFKLYYQP